MLLGLRRLLSRPVRMVFVVVVVTIAFLVAPRSAVFALRSVTVLDWLTFTDVLLLTLADPPLICAFDFWLNFLVVVAAPEDRRYCFFVVVVVVCLAPSWVSDVNVRVMVRVMPPIV